MQEKRLTHRLTEYWNQMREEASLPSWEYFDPASFGDMWQQCCGWKVDAENSSTIVYTYEYAGDSVTKIVGGSLKGKKVASPQLKLDEKAARKARANMPPGGIFLSHFHNFPPARILEKIDRTVKKPAIVIEEGRVVNGDGKNVRFRSCLLPFGTHDGKVTHMVLGLSWKTY
jgi:hypothetical protein